MSVSVSLSVSLRLMSFRACAAGEQQVKARWRAGCHPERSRGAAFGVSTLAHWHIGKLFIVFLHVVSDLQAFEVVKFIIGG